MMAADPTLISTAQQLVREVRLDPARAVWQSAAHVIDQLAGLGGYLAERTRDVADVRDRIVAALSGQPAPGVPNPDQVFAAFSGKKVVVRTLDAGADKPLPFLTSTDEANPALGVRGFRTSSRNPEVLEDQLTAIAQAAAVETADVWVMAPMVATVAETEEFVGRCHAHGLVTAGVMVEVPSAALQSGPILARAAFASVGTNDLTQYAIAADRLLGELATLSSPWQPAVLQLIAATCRGGAQHDRPVGVCAEAAADPALAVVLVGLGVATLSMTARATVRAHLPVLEELGL